MLAQATLIRALRQRVRERLRRKRAKTLRPMVAPSHANYLSDLLEIARDARHVILSELEPLLAELALRQDGVVEDKLRAALQRIKIEFTKPARAAHVAARMALETEHANRRGMNAQFRELAGIDVFSENPALATKLHAAIRRNVDLIESIPHDLLDDVERVIAPAIEHGTRVEVLRDQLAERFQVSESRAAFIARDQVGKLNGELVQARQQSLGLRKYIWSTSRDERVRGNPQAPKSKGDHYHLEGVECSWDDPPVVDSDGRKCHPGEDWQDRCQALPVIDDVLDALGVSPD